MKTNILLSIALTASLAVAHAENWTSSDGRSAEMTLIEVTKKSGERAGKFRLPNGKIVKVKAQDLNAADEEMAARMIEGTARSMGINVEG